METTPKITIEELAVKLNGKMWVKDDLKRIYLDRGYNTKKMSTKTYVFEKDGKFIVSCNVECSSQPLQWCDSQELQIIESVEKEITEALVTEYFLVINEDTAKFVDDCGTEKPINDLYGSDIYFSRKAAERFIKNELNGNYSVQQISREEFDRQVTELDALEKQKQEDLKVIQEKKNETFKHELIENLKGKTEFEKKNLCFEAWKTLEKGTFKDEIFEMFDYYRKIATDGIENMEEKPTETINQKQVIHERFGKGVIISEDGAGDFKKFNILFEDGVERNLLKRFARLTFL
jgi:hypothetical protein